MMRMRGLCWRFWSAMGMKGGCMRGLEMDEEEGGVRLSEELSGGESWGGGCQFERFFSRV